MDLYSGYAIDFIGFKVTASSTMQLTTEYLGFQGICDTPCYIKPKPTKKVSVDLGREALGFTALTCLNRALNASTQVL